MTWAETLRTGWSAIVSHRLRSVLTMLGIVIGVSSVILTVGLGQGAQDKVRKEISALGSNLLVVSPGSSTSSSGVRGGFGTASTLTLQDAAAIDDSSVVPEVEQVAATTGGSVTLLAGTTNWSTELTGTTPAWLEVRSRKLQSGRFFTQAEVEDRARVAVLGPDTASELFGGRSAVGQTITADGASLTVIGVLASSGSSDSDSSQDDTVVLPIGTAQQLTGETTDAVSSIYVQGRDESTLGAAYAEITALLLNLHDVSSTEADFTVTSQEALLETANSTNRTLTVLLGGIAAISLLVGGIGVMNIMLVSVTERVREIGLRKALGATPRVIRRQFLVEASLLGLAGGLLGVLLGAVGAQVLPSLIDQPVSLSALATLAAIGTALALGIGFGVYPASRAARLTPIDALRSE
jgi:putative ABC transport system permease protein